MRHIILVASLLLLAGCNGGTRSEATCTESKPGTIVTVNQYCAIMHDDPVDPELVTEYKGQKVGFCCKHCIPKWNEMTDAQKDTALAEAVAKGKVKS